jgi:hypothetical protein
MAMPIIQLSEHFTLQEAIFSSTAERLGIDNSQPSPEVIATAARTATKMEKVRLLLACALHVDSWIRCLALNRALGSKDTSQHIKGQAVDFLAPLYGTPTEVVKFLAANADLIRYDQIILEHTWVHISFCPPDDVPRLEVLSLLSNGGYAKGITDKEGNAL